VLTLVNSLSNKRHKELHYANTDEEMVGRVRQRYYGTRSQSGSFQIPLFQKDTDGSKPKSHYIMGRRNWCCITLKQPSGELSFDIRVEKEKGQGETVGYAISPLSRLRLIFYRSPAGILYWHLRHDGLPKPSNEPSNEPFLSAREHLVCL
jgi:hypothetical protein